MRILHITRERYDHIRSQGYTIKIDGPPRKYPDGGTTYHLMGREREFCNDCGAEFDSITPDTPADLDQIKVNLDTEEARATHNSTLHK